MRKILNYLLYLLLILAMLIPTTGAVKANAATSSKITVKKVESTLYVNKGEKTLYKTKYNKKTVYTTVGLNIRKGPDTSYATAMAAKPAGTKLTRVGIIKKSNGDKWAIIRIDKKYYFCANWHLTTKKPTGSSNSGSSSSSGSSAIYSASYFKQMGVINWNGWRWTWYSQRVLPGGGLRIPGRHVDSNGYVCDENDYICLASSSLSKGTVVSTPFGKSGKVYDSGCASNTLDVYTDW